MLEYHKTFREKLGDLLQHPGKRFLLGLLAIPLLGPFAVFISLSILEHTRTDFVKNITLPGSSGEIPCILLKRRYYCYMPMIPFVCLFFFLPYKTEYFLVPYLCAPNTKPDTRLTNGLLESGLLNGKPLNKKQLAALEENPGAFHPIFASVVDADRDKFLEDTVPFVRTGILKFAFRAPGYDVCHLSDNHYILMHYASTRMGQCGIALKDSFIRRLREETVDLAEIYFAMSADTMENALVLLNDKSLERLLRKQENPNPEAAQQVRENLSQNKKPLTREMIEKELLSRKGKQGKWLGGLLIFLSVGAAELAIAGIPTGVWILTVIFLPVCIWLFRTGLRKFRRSKENEKKILTGKYKVLAMPCSHVDVEPVEDEYDTVIGYRYTTSFPNGEKLKSDRSVGIEGDIFYLVYLEGSETVDIWYNVMMFDPDDSLRNLIQRA